MSLKEIQKGFINKTDMEDACQHKLCYNNEKDCSLFAVFDGHGGAATSQYASRYIESILSKQLNKSKYFSQFVLFINN